MFQMPTPNIFHEKNPFKFFVILCYWTIRSVIEKIKLPKNWRQKTQSSIKFTENNSIERSRAIHNPFSSRVQH